MEGLDHQRTSAFRRLVQSVADIRVLDVIQCSRHRFHNSVPLLELDNIENVMDTGRGRGRWVRSRT